MLHRATETTAAQGRQRGPVVRILAVTATLKRGSTRAGPRDGRQRRVAAMMGGVMKMTRRLMGSLQHQAPMRVGMEMMSMSMETMRERFCALASPSAPTLRRRSMLHIDKDAMRACHLGPRR